MRSVKCKNCGKEIRVDNNRYESVKNICCSNECRYEFARKNNKNEYILKDDICLIKIKDKFVKIDIDDVERVKKYTWYINCSGYVMTTVHTGRKDKKGIYHNILLHRFIMNVENTSYPLIDHINRTPLDNRKCNLRLADYQTNVINSSLRRNNKTGYKCINIDKKTGKYYVCVTRKGKTHYLGRYKTIEEAKQKYDEWVLQEDNQ